ncbi:putative permease [Streptococcus saliviloxodontae]|uniref:Permease n=2 Tax=Streptococcus saliviloxodontae TaxID=1349416 RepID=A0ABS2PKG9_9STRE|nr:putative permease [Streptococcus saliviloxodontae]
MVLLGYALAEKGWFDDKSSHLIARLVTQVALPCYMVHTITERFTAQELLRMIPNLRFPAVSMLLLLALAMVIAQLFAVDKSHRGLFVSMFFNSNTVFVGLPINQAIFGDESIPYVLIYYMCNTTFFWTIGTYLIQRDGNQTVQFSIKDSITKIFSPPLLGFLLGLLLVLLNIKLPGFLVSDLTYLGNLTIPLSMLFIGLSVSKAGFSQMRFQKDNLLILLGRFVISPLFMVLILSVTDLPDLMKKVFILQSAMPVMTNAPVVAKLYGADSDYAAVMVTETTLFTVVVIPLLMTIVS